MSNKSLTKEPPAFLRLLHAGARPLNALLARLQVAARAMDNLLKWQEDFGCVGHVTLQVDSDCWFGFSEHRSVW